MTSSTSLPAARRRPRPVYATTVALSAVLVVRPAPVRGAGGLRGGGGSADGDALVNSGMTMTNWALTTLEPPASSEVAVSIDPFTTELLATNFPYRLKYQTEHELSGAVSLHVALVLQEALDAPPLNVGLDCTKHDEPLGPERRWVLACAGTATFVASPSPRGAPDINEAVRQAFVGPAKSHFLETMYPRYEMVREKREWGVQRARRKKEKNDQEKKKKRKKKKKRSSNKKKKEKQKSKKKENEKKKQKKSRKNKKQANPNSGGRQQHESSSDGLNVMGYVSGSQGNGFRPPDENGSEKKQKQVTASESRDEKGSQQNQPPPTSETGGGPPHQSESDDEKGSAKKQNKGQLSGSSDDTSESWDEKGSQQTKPPKKPKEEGGQPAPSRNGELNVMGYVSGSQCHFGC